MAVLRHVMLFPLHPSFRFLYGNLPAFKLVMGREGNWGRQAATSLVWLAAAEAKLDVIYTRLTSGIGGRGGNHYLPAES